MAGRPGATISDLRSAQTLQVCIQVTQLVISGEELDRSARSESDAYARPAEYPIQ
jgi:hypothetical protein